MNALSDNNMGVVRARIKDFTKDGIIDYKSLLSAPSHYRIPTMVKNYGEKNVAAAVTVALTQAFNALNLRVGVSPKQVVEIAVEVLEEAQDDNLTLEDVLIFLKQLTTGKAGKIYDRMDMATFFELFESYRQERHTAFIRIKHEVDVNRKALGDTTRTCTERDVDPHRTALAEHLKTVYADKGGVE